MTYIEKTIKGLTHCTAWGGLHECQPKVGDDCPYEDEADCKLTLMRDALALLKEQAIGHWIFLTDCSNSGVYCSECNTKVFDSYPFKKKLSYFCPHCGTRMEGEIERR